MKKKLLIAFGLLAVVAIGVAGYGYSIVSSGFAVDKTVYVYIDENKSFGDLQIQLQKTAQIESISNFRKVASWLGYKEKMRTGRYAITPNMTVLDLVRMLRNGNQTPTTITFNNIRTKEDLAKRISEQLMFGEDELLKKLDDERICENFGLNKQTIVAMFIPNTYEFYWNIPCDDFLERMNKEYKRFWNDDRLAKVKAINLSPAEVSTLASIVEEECTYSDEYATVAGLYLNRLRKGQQLQADPTVKFAVGDFGIRRVLNIHLAVDSPYNTYRYAGLPPGPIRVPSIKGIDSVLNYQKNDYYYMCAKDDFSGRHNFAKTLAEHNRNADLYRRALDARGIKK